MNNRAQLLNDLIHMQSPLTETLPLLRRLEWDCDKPLVELGRNDIASVLNSYIQSKMTATEVEEWANAIESRDDIGYEPKYKDVILSSIYELANPLLTRPLTSQTALEWISRLSAS